jgi:tellurite resistance protein
MESSTRLEHFPISFFAVVMGLAGLTIAWQKADQALGLSLHANGGLVAFTATVFVLLALLYASKILRYPAAVFRELKHPVKLNFFPTISISLILLSVAVLPLSAAVAEPLWLAGTGLHLALMLYVVNVWMHHEHFQVHHMNPAWFIPAVGNALVPIAGVPLGYGELSWFFFSVGMLFWIVLIAIIFYRMLFHNPIDERLLPTLFILIAPPAVGFIAYTRLEGEVDAFARVLYHSGLFLTLLLLSQARRFLRLGFFLSWWAYSFPLAAISIATMVMFEHDGADAYRWLGTALLVLLTTVVGVLLVRTVTAVARRGICAPEQ